MHQAQEQQGQTRRGMIGGAAVAGAATVVVGAPALVRAADRAATTPCEPTDPGTATGPIAASLSGRTVWSTEPHTRTITAHDVRTLATGRSIAVGGAPVDLALTRDGRTAVVTTAHYDRPGLAIVTLQDGHVERVDVGPEPGAVVLTRSGRRAYVAGGRARGTVTRVDLPSGRISAPIVVGGDPRGLALSPDGKRAYVALNTDAQVAVVDLARKKVLARITTAAFPAQLALSPDGTRLLVTHNGFRARAVSLIDTHARKVIHRTRVGTDPAGVAFSRSGAAAIVTGNGWVALLDGRTGRRKKLKARPGSTLRGVAVAGRSGVVADARTGRLVKVSLGVGA